MGVCLIYIILTILCEVFSLLWIKFLCSSQKSVHLTESLLTPKCFLFVCFSSHLIFRGLCGLLSKYKRAFFTLHLPLEGRLIGKTHREAEKKNNCEKSHLPNRFKSPGNIYSFAMCLVACRGEGNKNIFSLPRGKGTPFFPKHHNRCGNVTSDTFVMTTNFC